MSGKAVPTALKPVMVDLTKGEEIHWCRCGRSKNPKGMCDGSHAREKTGMSPLAHVPEADGKRAICMCKATKNPPFCDGSHVKLAEQKGSGAGGSSLADIEDVGRRGAARSSGSGVPEDSTAEEPTMGYIKALASGKYNTGHGPSVSMGYKNESLPKWSDIRVLTAQLATRPLFDTDPVDTTVTIGARARRPLKLEIPVFVSDMSFGSLSQRAKVSLAKGAQLAGTGICSGEGGSLKQERHCNDRYFYELASAKFGWDPSIVAEPNVAAFHFKGGQGAKTGAGGHLPGAKVTKEIAEVRGLEPGKDAISPPAFPDLVTPEDFRKVAEQVRERSGGIPIGFKISAQHLQADIRFALEASADYIILDGCGGGTGSAPAILRDNISMPTMCAIRHARRILDSNGASDVTLIATGGLRTPEDFVKAIALGADAIAVSNSAIQAAGCIAARICGSNQCPSGIATQDPQLAELIDVEKASNQVANFFIGSANLMKVMSRACGHAKISDFGINDICTFKRDVAEMTGCPYAGHDVVYAFK